MSDCIKCWETPCSCGWDYKDWSKAKREHYAAVILGLEPKILRENLMTPDEHPQKKTHD